MSTFCISAEAHQESGIPALHIVLRLVLVVLLGLSIAGCANLLPNARHTSDTPWRTYAEAHAVFSQIVPGKTTRVELQAFGIDPERTANIEILDHVDLLRRLVPTSTFDIALLDPGIRKCAAAPSGCIAYVIKQSHLDRLRSGNFWLDFLNFKRTLEIAGWQFDAVVVVKDDLVVYKLWSGTPHIRRVEHENTPLGPLQGLGPSLFTR